MTRTTAYVLGAVALTILIGMMMGGCVAVIEEAAKHCLLPGDETGFKPCPAKKPGALP